MLTLCGGAQSSSVRSVCSNSMAGVIAAYARARECVIESYSKCQPAMLYGSAYLVAAALPANDAYSSIASTTTLTLPIGRVVLGVAHSLCVYPLACKVFSSRLLK